MAGKVCKLTISYKTEDCKSCFTLLQNKVHVSPASLWAKATLFPYVWMSHFLSFSETPIHESSAASCNRDHISTVTLLIARSRILIAVNANWILCMEIWLYNSYRYFTWPISIATIKSSKIRKIFRQCIILRKIP